MNNTLRHNCGLCVAYTLHDAYSFIKSLQHRGREATGIAAIGNERIDVLKWIGPVEKFDIVDLHKIFPGSDYFAYFAHVRYATRGRKEKILQDAHPHVIGGKIENRKSHIIIRDCDIVGVHNGQVNLEYLTSEIDIRNLKTGCDTEAFLQYYQATGEQAIMRNVPGAYTLAIADKKRKEIIVLRDRTGIKPGVLGWKNGKHCVASEDIALLKNGGEFIEDLVPGSIYYLSFSGKVTRKKIVHPNPRHCFFEWNYLADLNSTLNRISVRRVREALGKKLAEKMQFEEVDVVTFLPRCPEVAAREYTHHTDKEFISVFYKMRSERAFQGSTQKGRTDSIVSNLHLLPVNKHMIKDKIVLCIDDSTVRGNNACHERNLLYNEAGVKKAIHLNYTPKIGIIGDDGVERGCKWGVDMPPEDNFIARGRTDEEICQELGLEVHYISLEDMLECFEGVGIPKNHLCTFCIGGKHPFKE